MPRLGLPHFQTRHLIRVAFGLYHVKSPNSLIFEGPQQPYFSPIFEKILGIILFYANKIACHILVTICEPCRIPMPCVLY